MSAEVLREAARLMRSRAEEAVCPCGGPACTLENGGVRHDEMTARFDNWTRVVDHYVGMSPAVSVSLADWLEYVAQTWRMRPVGNGGPIHGGDQEQALAVATAYLGTR